jgi:hypothetical protein
MAYIPDGIRVPTHEAALSRGWGLGADEDGNRTREREWGKKIERRMEEERVDCYIKDKGANLVGALCVLQGVREDRQPFSELGKETNSSYHYSPSPRWQTQEALVDGPHRCQLQ